MPPIAPPPLILKPAGAPPMDHTKLPDPPVAVTVTGPYAEPWVPFGSEGVVTEIGGSRGVGGVAPADTVCDNAVAVLDALFVPLAF